MGSDREGLGRGSDAAAVRKPRKRQLVMESSDSEADEFCISTRQNASGAASVGNAGAGSQGSGDRSKEKSVTANPEKVSGVKSSDGDGSEKKTGVQLQSSSSQPAAKRIRVESAHGDGSGASNGGTGGKMLPRGLPTWRFERPEVRGGRVLDDKGGVGMKASSASKMEQVSSLGDKRRQVEPQKHERRTPLKTDQGKAIDSGQQEVLRLQGKRGVLRILPKNDKVARDTGDGKILSRQTEVDVETGNCRIPTKRGVLKLLPKNNGAVTESDDCKLLSKKVKKVHEETGDDKVPMKNTKVVDKETSDGKTLAITKKLDGEFGGHKVPMKNYTVDMETDAAKFQHRNSKADGETKVRYKGYEEKSGASTEFQKQDANDEKRVVGKLLSPVALRKSDPSVVGVSLGQRMKQQNSKQQLKNYSLTLKDGSSKSSEHKNLKKRLLEHKGLSESLSKKAQSKAVGLQGTSGPLLNKLGMKKPRGGPLNKHKQDLRNKIKRVLLDNGWKIDLRQRKNKDYEDSVYVSPVGVGYWSITKAYAVFQEQFQNMDSSSKLNNTKAGASDAISKDDLALLKKNIVKRRTNKEICGAEKKPGVSRNRSRSSKDILANRGSRNKHRNEEDRVKIKDRRCGLLVRGSTHDTEDNMDDYIPYEWKRTVYSWMIDLRVVSEDMQVKYMNNNRTREMLAGKITREGIFCGCCSKILTVAKFELHAGSKEKRPYANIFLEGGKVSLLQCLLDAWEKHTQRENKGFYKIDKGEDEHDDTCAICGDGGDLVCCDHCASTFHLDCLGIKLPSGDWYCRSCLCRFCGFPQEKPSSPPELLHSCLQCSRKYHQTCSSGTGTDSDCTIPGTSIDCFCSPGCRKIYKRLTKLLGIKNHMEAGFSWSLVRCFANDQAMPPKNKEKLAQCNSKIALAFTVLDECFQPHIDDRSGINIIHNVAYNCGSDFSRLDFSGFYAFILERGDEVISAASVRIHGTDLAEMPFVGTRGTYRHQGMFRRLLNGIESALCSLSVQKLVVSAVSEMENTWTTVFGFKPVEPSKKKRIKSLNLLIMNGTGLLEKRLLPTQTVDGQITTKTANAVGSDKMDAKMLGEASGSVTPVHVCSELDAADNLEIKCHESPRPLGNSADLTLDQSPAAEENEVKITIERTSPVSIGDVKTVKLHTLPPGANCGVDMQCMAEAENIQEEKYKETNGRSIAKNTISEQKSEDKSNSSHSNSLATPVTSPVSIGDVKTVKLHALPPGANCGVDMRCMAEAENIQEEKYKETNGRSIAKNTISEQKSEDKSNSSHSNSLATSVTVDQCSCLSNEIGKGENCLYSELSVGAAPITGKTESNLTSVHCANQTDQKAYAVPMDTEIPLVIMDEKPDKHELKTVVGGYSQSSMEAKSLEDRTGIVNGTSMDAYRDKGTNEDHSAFAVDSGVSVKLYVQQMEIIDKTGSLLPDLKHTSTCEDMLVTLTESKSLKNDMVEMDDATIKVGMTGESFNEAGITAPALNISDAVGENVVKPTQTCGEGQLRGDSNKSTEDDLASREPVNA